MNIRIIIIRKILSISFASLFFLFSTALETYALPICKGSSAKEGDNVSSWTNCKGTFTFADGRKYVGEFKNGNLHGQGTYTWAGGEKYVGEYKDGKRHGQGTFTFSNGHKYVGEWKNGQAHGQGKVIWANGDKYVGEYKNNKRHGQGTITWADGDKYVGEFKNGQAHGQGTYTYADGKTYAGISVDGGLTGKVGLKYYSREKNASNSQWRIGNIYAGGLGVQKDLHKAIEYYTKAAGKGHAKSKSALDSIRREHERKALEACMFENIKKVTNDKTERIVKKYCQNQIAEKSLKELLPKQKRKRAKWF